MRSLALVGCLLGCNGGGPGSLELTLSLPTKMELRPAGMTTVTVTATAPGESPISNTSAIGDDNRFTAGEFPIGEDVQLGVVLRDVSNRIVGVGEAGQTIDIVGDKATAISIPVRRPFVYAASGANLYSFDPTLDPRAAGFQGKVMGVSNPQVMVSVGGDRVAVISSTSVQIMLTADNTLAGSIPIPGAVTVTDATAVPGTQMIVVAHTGGMAIVDVAAGSIQMINVGPIDRVTAGRSVNGALFAYGLTGRVLPPEKAERLATCTGTSSIVTISLDAPATAPPVSVGVAISDIAAAPDQGMLFATLPCTGKVVRITGDLELGSLSLTDVASLERAAVLTVAGDRVFAAGTKMSRPVCTPGTDEASCTTTTQIACPHPNGGNRLRWVTDGASLLVQSIPLSGIDAITLNVPGRRETIIDTGDMAEQHAQVLKTFGVVPLDLVALPGGQYVGLATKSRYYVEDGGLELPCLDVTTGDWLLVDMASSAVALRVRTSCTGMVGASLFPWICEAPPDGQQRAFESYIPTSVGALFGAR